MNSARISVRWLANGLVLGLVLVVPAQLAAQETAAAARGSDQAHAAGPTETAPSVAATPDEAPVSQGPRTRTTKKLGVAQRIEINLRRLSRGLALDAVQEVKIRQILLDQHREILALRTANPPPGADVAAASAAIYDRTKDRIRSVLNEEQLKKYAVDVPREQLAPAQADLKHWMDLDEAKRREELAGGAAK